MNCMGTHDNVSDVLGIEWNFHAECIFYGTHWSQCVDWRSDPAKALGEQPCFPGVAALENYLEATPHLDRWPGIAHRAIINLAVDPNMSFDPGNWVNCYSFRHLLFSLTFVGLANSSETDVLYVMTIFYIFGIWNIYVFSDFFTIWVLYRHKIILSRYALACPWLDRTGSFLTNIMYIRISAEMIE